MCVYMCVCVLVDGRGAQSRLLPVGPTALGTLARRHPDILRPPEREVDRRDAAAAKRKQTEKNYQLWLAKKQLEFDHNCLTKPKLINLLINKVHADLCFFFFCWQAGRRQKRRRESLAKDHLRTSCEGTF